MPERIRSLQTLRFLAITLVFLSHCSFIVGPTGGALFSSAGAFGVSVFICLSGFLTFIARSGKGAAPAPIFGLRRVGKKIWKFYPLHVVTFLAALPLATFALSGGLVSIAEALVAVINLCLLQSWVPDSAVYFSFNAVSWFLSTYVLMIIATPFLMRLIACLKRGRKEAHRSVFVGAIAALAIIEFFLAAVSDGWSHAHWLLYIFPPVRLLDFGAGMLLGSLYCESDRFNSRTARKTFLGGGSLQCSQLRHALHIKPKWVLQLPLAFTRQYGSCPHCSSSAYLLSRIAQGCPACSDSLRSLRSAI